MIHHDTTDRLISKNSTPITTPEALSRSDRMSRDSPEPLGAAAEIAWAITTWGGIGIVGTMGVGKGQTSAPRAATGRPGLGLRLGLRLRLGYTGPVRNAVVVLALVAGCSGRTDVGAVVVRWRLVDASTGVPQSG